MMALQRHPLSTQRRRIAAIDGPRDGMADRLGNRRLARQASKEGCDDFWKKASASTLRCVALDCVAPFERDEIFTGRRIGSGSFSDVYEIKAFQLSPGGCYTPEEQRKREAMARDADSKYVIKHLKPSLEESERFPAAAYDISHEAEMLSALDHPNVVKIHGICARGHDAFLDGCEGYFIVLERLDTTLDRRLKIWSESRARAQNPMKLLKRGRVGSSDTEESPPSFVAKMGMASSLASAVEYLHSNGILFRDLKVCAASGQLQVMRLESIARQVQYNISSRFHSFPQSRTTSGLTRAATSACSTLAWLEFCQRQS